MKILLVEDEPQVASFIKKGFEHEGYELTIAYDGRTGWSLYDQQPYDLVILDVNLPHLNGVELCRLIRAGQRIVLTTREYSLLEHLLLNQEGRIVSRVDIAERVREVDFDTTTNVIDVYVSYLRKKIDRDFSPKLIHTVVGMGHVMRPD